SQPPSGSSTACDRGPGTSRARIASGSRSFRDLERPSRGPLPPSVVPRSRVGAARGGPRPLGCDHEELHRRQGDAAAEVYAEGGIAALVSLAEGVECPDLVVFAFARTEGGRREEEHLLATYLAAQNDAHGQFARGFSSGRISVEGRDWAHAKARAEASRWTF